MTKNRWRSIIIVTFSHNYDTGGRKNEKNEENVEAYCGVFGFCNGTYRFAV